MSFYSMHTYTDWKQLGTSQQINVTIFTPYSSIKGAPQINVLSYGCLAKCPFSASINSRRQELLLVENCVQFVTSFMIILGVVNLARTISFA